MTDIIEYRRKYYLKNRKRISKLMKKYYKEHCKTIKKRMKLYYQDRKSVIKNRINKYYQNNKSKIYIQKKKYYRKNKIIINKKFKQYFIKRRKSDINFKILCYLRARLYLALKGNPKLSTTMNLVGCSIDKLKQHLEKQFTKEMSFKNYGKWHIDHIKPCTKFDLSKKSEQKKCFNWQNLQPLWAKENLRKGTR